jgi:putative thioredoxin
MLDITHENLEADLINASLRQPVLLDIWAPWCGPCKTLGPILEKLETAYAGRFRLGKLNADEQPEIAAQLSQMFGVRSIPFCVLFKDGQPVDGFVGALPENKVREFLDRHVPTAAEAESEEDAIAAEEALAEGDTAGALERLQAAVATNPANDAARFDYLRALLEAGQVEPARRVFEPVAGKVVVEPRLAAIGHWLAACEAAPKARPDDTLQAAIAANRRDFEARFELAQKRFARQQFTQAMDELLEIVMRDKNWNDQLARKAYVAVLELMSRPARAVAQAAAPAKGALEVTGKMTAAPASDPLVDAYRRKLSMALF